MVKACFRVLHSHAANEWRARVCKLFCADVFPHCFPMKPPPEKPCPLEWSDVVSAILLGDTAKEWRLRVHTLLWAGVVSALFPNAPTDRTPWQLQCSEVVSAFLQPRQKGHAMAGRRRWAWAGPSFSQGASSSRRREAGRLDARCSRGDF